MATARINFPRAPLLELFPNAPPSRSLIPKAMILSSKCAATRHVNIDKRLPMSFHATIPGPCILPPLPTLRCAAAPTGCLGVTESAWSTEK